MVDGPEMPEVTMDLIQSCVECAVQNSNNIHANYHASLKYLVIHRTSLEHLAPSPIPNAQLTGPHLAKAFSDPALGTARRIPYHVLIRYPKGQVEQCLPLFTRGAHARGYNWCSLAVAVIGDTDERPCTDSQWQGLVDVCSILCIAHGGLDFVGHTALPGASLDPTKRCPGRYLSVDALAKAALSRTPTGWAAWTPEQAIAWVAAQGFRW